MIRRLIRRYRRPEPPRPLVQDAVLVRVMRGLYDYENEFDGGVR